MKILITSRNLLLSMSAIKNFIMFLCRLFGIEVGNTTPTVQPSTTVILNPALEMSETVLKQIVSEYEDDEEQGKIRKYIRAQEAKGIYNYSFETSKWRVVVQSTRGVGAQFYNAKKEQEGTSY